MNAARNTNSKNSSSKKPYCKVCHDAGKPESMYTNHCVKTYNVRTGKTETTCPTLNALECRYCYKSGHTVKFCPVLEENKKMDINRARDQARHQHQQQARAQEQEATRKPMNAYAALADDSDDEANEVAVNEVTTNEVAVNEVDEFPTLLKKSYSSVAATPRPVPVVLAPAPITLFKKEQPAPKKSLSWVEAQADDDDSDEEVYESDTDEQVAPAASLPCYAPRSQYTDEDW
jgi:hypothetical protein